MCFIWTGTTLDLQEELEKVQIEPLTSEKWRKVWRWKVADGGIKSSQSCGINSRVLTEWNLSFMAHH